MKPKSKSVLPHDVIDPQVQAYRDRDIETFASFYSSDVVIYRNGELFVRGIAALKEIYGQLFRSSPNLAIHIANVKLKGALFKTLK